MPSFPRPEVSGDLIASAFRSRFPRAVVSLRLPRTREHESAVAAASLRASLGQALPAASGFSSFGGGSSSSPSPSSVKEATSPGCDHLDIDAVSFLLAAATVHDVNADEGRDFSSSVVDIAFERTCERVEELVRCFNPSRSISIDCHGTGGLKIPRNMLVALGERVKEFCAVRVAQDSLRAAQQQGSTGPRQANLPLWWSTACVTVWTIIDAERENRSSEALAFGPLLSVRERQKHRRRRNEGDERSRRRHDDELDVTVWCSQDPFAFAAALASQEPALFLFRWTHDAATSETPPEDSLNTVEAGISQLGEVWQLHVLRRYVYREVNSALFSAFPMAPELGQRHILCDFALLLLFCVGARSILLPLASCRLVAHPQQRQLSDSTGLDSLISAYARYLVYKLDPESVDDDHVHSVNSSDILGETATRHLHHQDSDDEADSSVYLVKDVCSGLLVQSNLLLFWRVFGDQEVPLMISRWKIQHQIGRAEEARSLLGQIVVAKTGTAQSSVKATDESDVGQPPIASPDVVNVLDAKWKSTHYGTAEQGRSAIKGLLRGTVLAAQLLVTGVCVGTPPQCLPAFAADVADYHDLVVDWSSQLRSVPTTGSVFVPAISSHFVNMENMPLPTVVPSLGGVSIDFRSLRCGFRRAGFGPSAPETPFMNEPPLPTPTPYELEGDAAAYKTFIMELREGRVSSSSARNMWASALSAQHTIGYRLLQKLGWDGGAIGLRDYNFASDSAGDRIVNLAPVATELMMKAAMPSGLGYNDRGGFRPTGLGYDENAKEENLRKSDFAKEATGDKQVKMSDAAMKRLRHAARKSGKHVDEGMTQRELSFVSKAELHDLLLGFIEQQQDGDEEKRVDMVFPPTLTNTQRRMIHQEVRSYKVLSTKSVGVEPNRCIHIIYRSEELAARDKAENIRRAAEAQLLAENKRRTKLGLEPLPSADDNSSNPSASANADSTSVANPPSDVPFWMLGQASSQVPQPVAPTPSLPKRANKEDEKPKEIIPSFTDTHFLAFDYNSRVVRQPNRGGGQRGQRGNQQRFDAPRRGFGRGSGGDNKRGGSGGENKRASGPNPNSASSNAGAGGSRNTGGNNNNNPGSRGGRGVNGGGRGANRGGRGRGT